ncbi:hypothetical protein [Nonomuraea sp. 10N515B]|uniref:hypothetical protein n=1 Tax=Nonomuraea sp. 10N515B TaxID=3457422 RepID=UPI003FCE5B84
MKRPFVCAKEEWCRLAAVPDVELGDQIVTYTSYLVPSAATALSSPYSRGSADAAASIAPVLPRGQ